MGYYVGDFYRGDPGFFSFIGRLAKGALGSILPGGGTSIMRQAPQVITAGGRVGGMVRAGAGAIRRGVVKHPVLSAAGAAGVIGATGGALARGASATNGGVRRRRRMNVVNIRALRRALRRVGGFAHAARKVMHYTQKCHHGKTLRFKFPKRKRAA